MRHTLCLLLGWLLLMTDLSAQELQCLKMPNQELLSCDRVLFLMEDSEGCLWYATEGGGVCRDDGRQMDVFRSDAAHPELLGSNNVACLAESGRYIIIGTFHGAYALDKKDFSISRMAEIDDKRVDDIITLRCSDILLTANMKVYRFDSLLTLKATYPAPGNYVARLFEDAEGRIWATQWQGGLLRLKGDKLVEAKWELDAQATDLADGVNGTLWVGTMGRGVVCYHPDDGLKILPYGRPLANQTMHILDENLEPCPTMVTGQIALGGDGVALGYYLDEERTAAQFVDLPSTGEHVYLTGDMGRYLPGGEIEFQGRKDNQVNVYFE